MEEASSPPLAAQNPLVVIIAGPNGAGKSTTAPYLLRGALAVSEFVNADTIALGLSAFCPETVALSAGRIMLSRMNELAAARRDFAFETTLAGRNFAPWLERLRGSGYRSHLIFLSLPSPEIAIARVAERVRMGGHFVPDDVVRRRYAAGLRNFFSLYQRAVDSWQLFDNTSPRSPMLTAESLVPGSVHVRDRAKWYNLGGEKL